MAAAGAVIIQVLRRQYPALRFCPPSRPVPPRASCSVNERLPSWRSRWGREQADARSSRTLRTPVSGFFNVGRRKQHSPRLCTYGLHCRLYSPPLLRLPVSYGHDTDCIIACRRTALHANSPTTTDHAHKQTCVYGVAAPVGGRHGKQHAQALLLRRRARRARLGCRPLAASYYQP